MNQPARSIRALKLPSGKFEVVRNGSNSSSVFSLSGPDAEGRIAYLEDHLFEGKSRQRHVLKKINIDGTQDDVIFSRPGSALWAATPAGRGEIGSELALSATGGKVAFLSGLVPVQMPSAYLHVGQLEIWDVATKKGSVRANDVLDAGLAWFPDGKRLAIAKLVALDKAKAKTPAVHVLDLATGRESFLAEGRYPLVSANGDAVLFADDTGRYRSVSMVDGKATDLPFSTKECPRLIANPSPACYLTVCQTSGDDAVAYKERNSPLVGAKRMMTLKLFSPENPKGHLIAPAIDPRTILGFGAAH